MSTREATAVKPDVWNVKKNQTDPTYFTLYDKDGAAKDLTGKTLTLYVRKCSDLTVPIDGHAVTLVTAASGACKYTWGAGEIATAGKYYGYIREGTSEVARYPSDKWITIIVGETNE